MSTQSERTSTKSHAKMAQQVGSCCVICERKYHRDHFKPTMLTLSLILAFLLSFCTDFTSAHVGLTFPPARTFDLDFLDKIRTKPPCGMPKGTLKTSLIAGSKFNVTWHLSYPHRGGYRLELMDSKERQLLDLTPKTDKEDYIKGDPTAQSHMVELPKNFTCEDCTIRLLREASEWSNNYRFWSCADVDIVEQKKYKENCMGHGRPIAGRCVCNKGFSGSRCQYEDECDTDAECHGNGKCINLGGSALPRKQCFCNPGFHGVKCSKRNTVKLPSHSQPLDFSSHTKRILSDRLTLYYKVVPASQEKNKELEFILIINGTSYGAIGWRPASLDKTCKGWPYIQNLTSTAPVTERQGKSANLETAESKPEPEAEAEAEAPAHDAAAEPESSAAEPEAPAHDAASEPESEAEPKSDAEPEAEAEPGSKHAKSHDPSAEPENEADEKSPSDAQVTTRTVSSSSSSAGKLRAKLGKSKSSDDSEVNVESTAVHVSRPKRSPESEDAKSEPEPETESEPETKAEPEPETSAAEPEPKSEPESEPEGEPTSESEPESEAEPGSDSVHAASEIQTKKYKVTEWTPKGEFHAMDCIDLIMGGANGIHSRIRDYYTRDRSTPRLDTFWGGSEDITSATGWEKDGMTTLIFRRKVRSADEPDHNLEGELHVIWARGQEPGEYYHRPRSGLEIENPGVPEFYARDEIKYHGHGGQRGITRIDFLSSPKVEGAGKKKTIECGDSWSYPSGCVAIDDEKKPCSYTATWVYQPDSDSVKFTIETKKSNRWTGIGFSDSPLMKNSDAILGWVTSSGQYFMMDTFMTSYTPPVLDREQDISGMTGQYADGIVRLTFSRPVKSKDAKDVSLDTCRFFLFPVEGGTYDAVSKKIRKHESTPISSSDKICIPTTCRPSKPPRPPPEIRYTFDIKLIGGLGNNWQPPPRESEDFAQLGNRLRRDLEGNLKKIPGYNSMKLTEVKRESDGGVTAKLDLAVSPQSELADMAKVEKVLKDTIGTGQVGALQLDPQSFRLVLQEPEIRVEDEYDGPASYFSGQRFWIVLGCVAALILLAIVQAGLTIYKTTSKSSMHKGSPSSGSGMAWRDYSETNYGYDAYDEKTLQENGFQMQTSPGHVNPQPNHSRSAHQDKAYHDTLPGNGHHGRNGYGESGHRVAPGEAPPPSYRSLPRAVNQQGHHPRSNGGGGGGGGGGGRGGLGAHNADFYFMPSQRKYSGEVVRVYVDHNRR